MSPYRWGEPREKYDPEADVGLPRPFLLGEKVETPVVTHGLAHLPSGGEQYPIQPYHPPRHLPVPAALRAIRHWTDLHGSRIRLTAADVAYLRHLTVLIGLTPTVISAIIGRDHRAGVYITYFDTGLNRQVYIRTPDGAPPTSQKAMAAWVMNINKVMAWVRFLARYDKKEYVRFRDWYNDYRQRIKDTNAAASANAYNQWLVYRAKMLAAQAKWDAEVRRYRRP